jgi:hypothetical protein
MTNVRRKAAVMAPPIDALSLNPKNPLFWIVVKNCGPKFLRVIMKSLTPWSNSIPPQGRPRAKDSFSDHPPAPPIMIVGCLTLDRCVSLSLDASLATETPPAWEARGIRA